MRKHPIFAAAFLVTAALAVSPALAKPAATNWAKKYDRATLEWFVDIECVEIQRYTAELIEAEEELSIIKLNFDLVYARIQAAVAAGEGEVTYFPGGYVDYKGKYSGTPEFMAVGELHGRFHDRRIAAWARVASLKVDVEHEEYVCASARAALEELAPKPKPPAGPRSTTSATADRDKFIRETGGLGHEKLRRETEDTKTIVEEAKAAGEKALAATETLPYAAYAAGGDDDSWPRVPPPPGGGTLGDGSSRGGGLSFTGHIGGNFPVNDPELQGFNQNLTLDPGLDLGGAISFNFGEIGSEPEYHGQDWYEMSNTPMFSVGGEADWQTANADRITNQFAPGVLNVSGDYDRFSLLLTGAVEFPLGDDMDAELLLGAGVAWTSLELNGPGGGTIVDDEDTVFTWLARATIFLLRMNDARIGFYGQITDAGDMDATVAGGGPAFEMEGVRSVSFGLAVRY